MTAATVKGSDQQSIVLKAQKQIDQDVQQAEGHKCPDSL